MEQELKFALPDKQTADTIWENSLVSKYGNAETKESLVMKAIYFDTEDMALAENNMTIRVRSEGDNKFATLKWGGCSINGFHERNEINIPVNDDSFIAPSADLFIESEDGNKLHELLAGKELTNLLEMRFLRRKIRLSYQQSIVELALDSGDIITDNGERPILELELELLYGNTDDLKALGNEFQSTYDIKPENKSKFARGLELLK